MLEAVIQTYVETAEPPARACSRARFGLGVSPATIRNTMSDLEEKGFLFHPHTSAGRVPTDKAYRAYVDSLLNAPRQRRSSSAERERLHAEISPEQLDDRERSCGAPRRALGVLTQELGVALGPRLDASVLRRLELVRVSSERLLLVLTLEGGVVRTVFVEVRGTIADTAVAEVTRVLNERLAGLTLREIRTSRRRAPARLRDESRRRRAAQHLRPGRRAALRRRASDGRGQRDLGQACVLAEQPEFGGAENMRRLLDAHRRARSASPKRCAASTRRRASGVSHHDRRRARRSAARRVHGRHRGVPGRALTGVIGVIGPTRMPYEKVISLVQHTSRLLTDLL